MVVLVLVLVAEADLAAREGSIVVVESGERAAAVVAMLMQTEKLPLLEIRPAQKRGHWRARNVGRG